MPVLKNLEFIFIDIINLKVKKLEKIQHKKIET